jgi:hypothetical protein
MPAEAPASEKTGPAPSPNADFSEPSTEHQPQSVYPGGAPQ